VAELPKLYEVLLSDLLAAIVRGDYPEGARLPRETDLAASYEVSRAVARQSIQGLVNQGVVVVKHGVGQVVAPRHRWNLFDPTLFDALLAGPDADAAREDAAECSRLLWPAITALAAERRSAEDLRRLDAAESELDFKAALLTAARNRFLGQAVSVLDHAMSHPNTTRPASSAVYRDVLEAIRGRDADLASAAMASVKGATVTNR
jgi:DNA-binding FadR family transcriptional regulator